MILNDFGQTIHSIFALVSETFQTLHMLMSDAAFNGLSFIISLATFLFYLSERRKRTSSRASRKSNQPSSMHIAQQIKSIAHRPENDNKIGKISQMTSENLTSKHQKISYGEKSKKNGLEFILV